MGRQGDRQRGFSIVEAVLVVAVIGVIGVGGWFVYQHNRTKPTGATGGAQSTNQNSSQQPTTTTPAPTVSYLTLTQWGIKLPLSNAISDAYYVPGISSKGADGLPNQIWVGFKSLDGYGCTATNSSGPALIFRALPTDTDPVSGQLLTEEYPNGVTIGSYYYGYEDFTTSSSNTCKAPQTTLQSVHTALANATKTAVTAAN